MAKFKERYSPTTSVKVLQFAVPTVTIDPDALTKMQIFVEECNDEVGWLGTAYRNEKNEIHIDDVYLFDQEVHATTTEITPEGLAEFGERILLQPDGMEIWNNLKVWGHSHVNMAVTPSGQDDRQMETFADGGHDWFIRIIANKQGELKVDLYDYQSGIIYLDLPWETAVNQEEEVLHRHINELYRQLEEIEKSRMEAHREPVKEEMKEKVRKKVYHSATTSKVNSYLTTNGTATVTDITKKKEEKESAIAESETGIGAYRADDVLEDDEGVLTLIGINDLLDLSYCNNIYELDAELQCIGFYNFFSDNDLKRILRVAKQAAIANSIHVYE